MADQQTDETVDDEEEAKGGGKLKLIIIAVVALLLLGGGGGAAAYFMGLFGGDDATVAEEGSETEDGDADAKKDEGGSDGDGAGETADATTGEGEPGGESELASVFVDLPDVLVNLQSESRRSRFLKLKVALEVEDATTAETVKNLFPRILDSFQLYLRALTAEEVNGSAGMQRLKAEMLARINNAIKPIRVSDLLFKEMLVQ